MPTTSSISNLRGPGKNVRILATAMAPTSTPNGTGEHEPIIMAIFLVGRRSWLDPAPERTRPASASKARAATSARIQGYTERAVSSGRRGDLGRAEESGAVIR